jgi:succinate-semialdehyde dehydrogenase/glutarate-semialdehyde dehydrogenase
LPLTYEAFACCPSPRSRSLTCNRQQQLKDSSLFIQDAFIDGEWVSKENKFDVFEPSTATVLGKVANCALEDFQKAIKSADAAQTKFFETTTGTSRGALLRKWYELVLANQEDRE